MNLFSPISLGASALRLPMSPATGGLIAATLLAPSSERRAALKQRLRVDGSFNVWATIASRSECWHNADRLVDWLNEQGPGIWSHCASLQSAPAANARLVALAGHSAALAMLAEQRADFERIAGLAHLWLSPHWASLAVEHFAQSGDVVEATRDWVESHISESERSLLQDCEVQLEGSDWPKPVADAALEAQSLWADSHEELPLAELARVLVHSRKGEADLELELARRKLESLAEFAAGAGHEINNPLAVISGRAQLLLAGETHPDRRQDLATIHAQARRIHEMIAGWMLFARPPEPTFAEFELGKVIRRTADGFSQRGASLRLGNCDNLRLTSDAEQLGIALALLIENSIAATRPGSDPDIQIEAARVSRDGEFVRIVVIDRGQGMSDETRAHAFDPLYSGRAAGRGLGVGLSKAWRIVMQLGGSIRIADTSTEGTTIELLLPMTMGNDSARPPGAPDNAS